MPRHILASAALLSASDARLATTEVKLRRLRHHHVRRSAHPWYAPRQEDNKK